MKLITKVMTAFLFSVFCMFLCTRLEVNAQEIAGTELKTEQDSRSSEGNAYAVLTSEGELIFFRSTETYADKSERTVKDILGNTYTGTVFAGVESLVIDDDWGTAWYPDYSRSIKSAHVASGQTIRPASMHSWFKKCSCLTSFDAEGFDTSLTKDMSSMFAMDYEEGSVLEELDLSSFDTSSVTDMSRMFEEARKLKKLDISSFNTSNVENMCGMFSDCISLESLDVTGFNTSKVRDMSAMFCSLYNVTSLDVSHMDLSGCTTIRGMFSACGASSFDFSAWDTSNVEDMRALFKGCRNFVNPDLSGLDTSNVNDMEEMFAGCENLESLDLSSWNTENLIYGDSMFERCGKLKSLNISTWNTQVLGYTKFMFMDCVSLKEIDLSRWHAPELRELNGMFENCRSLESMDLSSLKPERIWTMPWMFLGCVNLKKADISGFKAGEIANFGMVFADCPSLKELNMSDFTMESAEHMYSMFENCESLETLDLSNFRINDSTYCEGMFSHMTALKTVKLGPELKVWKDTYLLPEGQWTNKAKNITLSETQLAKQYPANANAWAGTWERTSVRIVPVEKLRLYDEEFWIRVGDCGSFGVKVVPENATDDYLVWSIANPAIAEVDVLDLKGHDTDITGKRAGRTTLTVSTRDGKIKETVQIRVLFQDVSNMYEQYYFNPVYWAVDKGITNGYTGANGLAAYFRPQNNCTREAVVTFLWRLAGRPEPKSMTSKFKDVQDSSKYYYKAVLWAAEKGIAGGYSDGTFRPDDTCLREHVVTFLWRYAGKPNPGITKNPFNDVKSSDYYYRAALWANAKGIAKGYTTGQYAGGFGPKLDCLREHVVTFLYRYAK